MFGLGRIARIPSKGANAVIPVRRALYYILFAAGWGFSCGILIGYAMGFCGSGLLK